MTDIKTNYPLKQLLRSTFSAKVVLSSLLSICVLAQPANAVEQQWWFDVEVILFERNLEAASISEKFKQSRLVQPSSDVLDILTPYLKPDLSYLRAGLPYCRTSNQLAVKTQQEQSFAFHKPVVADNEASLLPIDDEKSNPISDTSQSKIAVIEDANNSEAESFQYQVATTDIFSQSDSENVVAEVEDLAPFNSEQVNEKQLDQQNAIVNINRLPIQVEFIEWQIPSELPCAYSEQIDPSFASMSDLQGAEFGEQPKDLITRVPVVIHGIEWPQKRSAFLLPTANMRMDDLYNKIKRQRDITPILHVNWRQQVYFGRENGQTIRLFAGQNFADQFDANGLPLNKNTDSLFNSLGQKTEKFYIPEQELTLLSVEQQQALFADGGTEEPIADDLFARIEAALSDDSPITFEQSKSNTEQHKTDAESAVLDEIWRIDGGITVYLRNIGRVPYLHIDSDLDFRQPIFDPKKTLPIQELSDSLSEQGAIAGNQLQQSNYLQSANFNQLRRVISKQVHYFDHPLFGMLVQINRYRWPQEPQDSAESEQDNLNQSN